MNLAEANEEYVRLSNLLSQGLTEMRTQAAALAQAENEYRKAKSEAWMQCPNDAAGVKAGEREWTAARREAWVNAATADQRQARDLAEGMSRTAYQAVQARRTQISALQTFLNAYLQELKFAQTEPGMAA